MMLINLQFNSLVELDDFVAHYTKNKTTTTAPAAPAPKTDTPEDAKTDATPKAEPKAPATPKAEPKAPATPKAEPKAPATPKADPKPEGELSYANDIAPRVLKLAEAKGRDAAIAVLSQFGVTKAPQLDVGQYAEFVQAVDAKLAED